MDVDEIVLLSRIRLQVEQVVGVGVAGAALTAVAAGAPVAGGREVRQLIPLQGFFVESVPPRAPLVGDELVLSLPERPLSKLELLVADAGENAPTSIREAAAPGAAAAAEAGGRRLLDRTNPIERHTRTRGAWVQFTHRIAGERRGGVSEGDTFDTFTRKSHNNHTKNFAQRHSESKERLKNC